MKSLKNKKIKNAPYYVSIKIILKRKDRKVLLLKMPQNSSMSGYYDLLGGRIKADERDLSFREIIKRELEEEIGRNVFYSLKEIPVAIGRHSYFTKKGRKVFLFWVFFEAHYKKGGIKISPEHENYKWARINRKNLKRYFVRGPLEGMRHYVYKKLK